MFKVHCLNKISKVGTSCLSDNYITTETIEAADAILVRSAAMHEMEFDKNLGILMEEMRMDDLLIITADHGNDPTYTGTDHTREKVPFIAYSKSMEGNGLLPEENTFAVIGATVADNFGLTMPKGTIGTSVLEKLS